MNPKALAERLELLKIKKNLDPKEQMELFKLHYELNIMQNAIMNKESVKNCNEMAS